VHARPASAGRMALVGALVAAEPPEVPAELPLRGACFRDHPPEAEPSLRTRTDRSTWERPRAVGRPVDLAAEERANPAADLGADRAHREADLAAEHPSEARLGATDAGCRRDPGSSWRRRDSDLRGIRRARDCWGSKDLPEAPAEAEAAAAGAHRDSAAAVAHILVVEVRPGVAAGLPIPEAAHNRPVLEVDLEGARRDFGAVLGAGRIVPVEGVVAAGVDPIRVGTQQVAAVPETCRDAARPKRAAGLHTKRRICSWAYSKCRSAGTRSSSPTSERANNTGRCRPVAKRGQHTCSVPDRIVFVGSASRSFRRLFRRGFERPYRPKTGGTRGEPGEPRRGWRPRSARFGANAA
jgi:hypothetical protein